MVRILIADAGSSKTDWALLQGSGSLLCQFKTEGINPLTASDDKIKITLGISYSYIEADISPDIVYFYGAGCATETICRKMEKFLKEIFGCKEAHVYSDLIGAARSLLGEKTGVACILGTGSNSCLCQDGMIVKNIPSLGYVLGDEGSGNALGKKLLTAALRKWLPDTLDKKFRSEYDVSLRNVLKNVYGLDKANSYLASFVPFLASNKDHPFVHNLITDEIKRFFQNIIRGYEDFESLPLYFTGSVAYHFADILYEVAQSMSLQIVKIIKSPIEGLIEYHSSCISKND